uniref:Uncharacterized protein n=1 Tax=Arundo donax TaxID=35708 RepID=A0A0A8ZH15_ARUDO
MCGKLSFFMVVGAESYSSTLDALYEKGNSMSNM